MLSTKRQVQVGATRSLFDDLIDSHALAYAAAYPEVKEEFGNYDKSGTGNFYIGMVYTEDFEKPDPNKGIKIRGSHMMSKNRLIELDLSAVIGQHSFFPGQIVAFFADPYVKQQLTVRKFLDPMRICPPMKRIEMVNKINLIIACGPYIKQDTEDWSLFENLMEKIKAKRATHVILIGPFVDMDNKTISCDYDANWKRVFGKIVEGLHDHECQIYLVPSNKDVLYSSTGSNFFYPTSNIELKPDLKEGSKLKFTLNSVMDPDQIDLGGVYLDVTSAEVLLHLTQCSSFINRGSGAVFNDMFKHLLTQGVYPIYPPPKDMPVDYPKLEKHIKLERFGPHILVLPTRFHTPPVNNINDRIVVTIQKCSLKKQIILLKIPKIESSHDAPVNLISDYEHELIDLSPEITLTRIEENVRRIVGEGGDEEAKEEEKI